MQPLRCWPRLRSPDARFVLRGCKTVGPNYKAPPVPAPPSFSDEGHNGDWAAAAPADAADRGAWWAIYQESRTERLWSSVAPMPIRASRPRCTPTSRPTTWCARPTPRSIPRSPSAARPRAMASPPTRRRSARATARDFWAFLIPLNISWEPDFWGAVRRQIESASASAQASAADLANTRLSLQGLLAVTYLQLRGLDLQAQLLRSTIDAYTQTLQLTQVRLKGGLSTESDVAEAQAQLEEARAQLIDLGVQRAQYEHAIAVLDRRARNRVPHSRAAARRRSARHPHRRSLRAAPAPSRHRRRRAPRRRRQRADRRRQGCVLPQHHAGRGGRHGERSGQPHLQLRQRGVERRPIGQRAPLRRGPPPRAGGLRHRPARAGHRALSGTGIVCLPRCGGPALRAARAAAGGRRPAARGRCRTPQHRAIHTAL